MRYRYRVTIRIIIALLSLLVGYKIIYFLISPLTFYSSYYSLFYLEPIKITSNSFVVNGVKLNFISACAAASAYLLLLLLVLLTDIKLKEALRIFFVGSLLIFAANIIRIDILIITLIKYGSSLFNTLHLLFWKILSTIYVVLLWIFLTKTFKIKEIPIYSDFMRFY